MGYNGYNFTDHCHGRGVINMRHASHFVRRLSTGALLVLAAPPTWLVEPSTGSGRPSFGEEDLP